MCVRFKYCLQTQEQFGEHQFLIATTGQCRLGCATGAYNMLPALCRRVLCPMPLQRRSQTALSNNDKRVDKFGRRLFVFKHAVDKTQPSVGICTQRLFDEVKRRLASCVGPGKQLGELGKIAPGKHVGTFYRSVVVTVRRKIAQHVVLARWLQCNMLGARSNGWQQHSRQGRQNQSRAFGRFLEQF